LLGLTFVAEKAFFTKARPAAPDPWGTLPGLRFCSK
jgi:hypothetical protein